MAAILLMPLVRHGTEDDKQQQRQWHILAGAIG